MTLTTCSSAEERPPAFVILIFCLFGFCKRRDRKGKKKGKNEENWSVSDSFQFQSQRVTPPTQRLWEEEEEEEEGGNPSFLFLDLHSTLLWQLQVQRQRRWKTWEPFQFWTRRRPAAPVRPLSRSSYFCVLRSSRFPVLALRRSFSLLSLPKWKVKKKN